MVQYIQDFLRAREEIESALREYFTEDELHHLTFDGKGNLIQFYADHELTPEELFTIETLSDQKFKIGPSPKAEAVDR